MGLLIDRQGAQFDGRQPSDLETLLNTHALDDTALLDRARGVIARLQDAHLGKYSALCPDIAVPPPGYVLVVDQPRGDASVQASGADRSRFLEMLFVAREENPGARIVLKTHPETATGRHPGYFTPEDSGANIQIYDDPASPWTLLDGATGVYTVSSQMGFEAILAGHRPRVFGSPFYAGWGLTVDEDIIPRRRRNLTRAQLCAAALILYPRWYDPHSDRLAQIEDVLAVLEARARAEREDRSGWVASGIPREKRAPLQKLLGQRSRLQFEDDVDKAEDISRKTSRKRIAWASKAQRNETRIEDGFLRSIGLGAAIVPPLSFVLDSDGIYYDPTRPSTLEGWIHHRAAGLRVDQTQRIHNLIRLIVENGLSKDNNEGDFPSLPPGRRILVPEQIEDGASILKGSPNIATNTALLARVRADNPEAVILWKPHPDTKAGLRKGSVDTPERWADLVLNRSDIGPLLHEIDEVWTMTSITGFEALLHGTKVVTLGAPFYAGWGLTRDLGPVPARRIHGPRPNLEALAYAALIDYPRYFDPLTGSPWPVETVVNLLKTGQLQRRGIANKALAKLKATRAWKAGFRRR